MISSFRGKHAFLSNMFYSPLRYIKINTLKESFTATTVPTVEHAYQASKAKTKKNALIILNADSPAIAKSLGFKLKAKGKLRSDWFDVSEGIMSDLICLKFEQNPYLLKQLKLTKEEFIVEHNIWHDNFYGDCQCKKCSDKPGLNKLGKQLMRIRRLW